MAGVRYQANRGSALEDLILRTIQANSDVSAVKIPTPWTPVRHGGAIEYVFPQRATVDFIGVAAGRPVAFDAKEVSGPRFEWERVSEHQARFLQEFSAAGGIGFLAVAWWPVNSIFLAPVEQWFALWESARRPSMTLSRARDGWIEVPMSQVAVRPFGSAFWRAVGTLVRPAAEYSG